MPTGKKGYGPLTPRRLLPSQGSKAGLVKGSRLPGNATERGAGRMGPSGQNLGTTACPGHPDQRLSLDSLPTRVFPRGKATSHRGRTNDPDNCDDRDVKKLGSVNSFTHSGSPPNGNWGPTQTRPLSAPRASCCARLRKNVERLNLPTPSKRGAWKKTHERDGPWLLT